MVEKFAIISHIKVFAMQDSQPAGQLSSQTDKQSKTDYNNPYVTHMDMKLMNRHDSCLNYQEVPFMLDKALPW